MDESEVLAKYVTPGLRKNTLDRAAKKDQLNALKIPPDDRDIILNQLYGPEHADRTH
jgi:hypothetical protein